MRMMNQPNSPLSIKASYFPQILPWLIRFVLQSRQNKVLQNARNLHALSKHAVESWQSLFNQTELSPLFRETGWLKVYENERTFNGTLNSRKLLDAMGTPYEILSSGEIQDLEPNLAPIYKKGFYQKNSLSITNPQRLVTRITDLFVSSGGQYQQFDASTVQTENDSVTVNGPQGQLSADKVVLATGAYSGNIIKQLGDRIPLDTERGYHLMMPESSRYLLKRPVVNAEQSFVLSPMDTGLRMTSQVEFAGLKAKPNYELIRRLLPSVKRMLPDVDLEEQSTWMGCRPSLPDSLPVIGRSAQSNRVIYAFGHQHLGMTLGAITGRCVADLISNKKTIVPLTPYQANRFNKL